MNTNSQQPNQPRGMWANVKLCTWSKDLLQAIRQELAPNGFTTKFKKVIAVVPPQFFLTKERIDRVAYLALVRASAFKEAIKLHIERSKSLTESELSAIMAQYEKTSPLLWWKRSSLESKARELANLRDVLAGELSYIDSLGPRTTAKQAGPGEEVDPLEDDTRKEAVMQSGRVSMKGPDTQQVPRNMSPTPLPPATGPDKKGETPEDRHHRPKEIDTFDPEAAKHYKDIADRERAQDLINGQ